MERTIVAAASAGSEEAFARLVESHYAMIRGLAFSFVRDWSAAEDIAQETFLVAWKNLNRLRDPRAFLMWLRKIARNLALNWVRSDAYRRALAERFAQSAMAPSGESIAETNAAQADLRAELECALESMSTRVREVMTLFYFEQYSILETAQALGINESTVKKRLHRGRAQLRSHLERDWQRGAAGGERRAFSDRILAGMALGPAAPEFGGSVSAGGLSVVSHHLTHGGSLSVLKPIATGGIFMSMKSVTVVGLTILVAVIAALLIHQGRTSIKQQAANESESGVDVLAQQHTISGNTNEIIADPSETEDTASTPTATFDDMTTTPDASTKSIVGAPQDESPLHEDNPTASLAGRVVDQWHGAVPGANVVAVVTGLTPEKIKDIVDPGAYLTAVSDFENHHVAVSDLDGQFSISGIQKSGMFMLFAFGPGFSGYTSDRIDEGEDYSGVEILVRGGSVLAGRVLSANRQPIEGVLVKSVGFVTENSSGGASSYAITGPEGHFELLFKSPGYAALQTISREYGQRTFVLVPVGSGEIRDFVYEPPARIHGTVNDGDGAPVSGAIVHLNTKADMYLDSGRGGSVATSGYGAVHSRRTDVDGAYSFEDAAPNSEFEIHVGTSSGLRLNAPHTFGPLRPGQDIEMNLIINEMIIVSGRVVGALSRMPLSNVNVACMKEGRFLTPVPNEVDDQGRFEITIADGAGEYVLRPYYLNPSEFQGEGPFDVALTLDYTTPQEVELELEDPMSISLQVVDSSGQPIADARISGNWHPKPGSTYGGGEFAVTDASGRFSWHGFTPIGTWQLWSKHDEFLSRLTHHFEGVPDYAYPEEQVTLYQRGGVAGIAINAAGDPLSGFSISATASSNGETLATARNVTDQTGYFVFARSMPATTIELLLEVRNDALLNQLVGVATHTELELLPGTITDLGEIVFAP